MPVKAKPTGLPEPRGGNRSYLGFIRMQPCCICGNDVNVEAHHPRVDLPGMAKKADDRWAVPLCGKHHRELHTLNEREWWASYGLDPSVLALRYQVML